MPTTPTLDNPVFISRHSNLIVTRFPESKPTPQDRNAPRWPGLRYEFGKSVGQDSEGMEIYDQAVLVVDDALRERDWAYIEEYGEELTPEKPLSRQQRKEFRNGELDVEEAFLTTEEWLREHLKEVPGSYFENPVAAPPSGPVMQKIMDLLLEEDIDGLIALGEQELHSWQRPDVMNALERAGDRLEAKRKEREQENATREENTG